MTDHRRAPAPSNRRFLVSLWQLSKARPEGREPEAPIRGTVWEADPRDPGRIATPESFVGLEALPTVLKGLLARGADPAEDRDEGEAR